jgi:tRNA A37 N6-isopentenylltransferase MiaA
LLIDEEEEIAILASNLELLDLTFNKKNKVLKNRFFTRSEIMIRKFLIKEIEECYHKKNYGKLRFLYEEYFDSDTSSYQKMKDSLLNSMKNSLDTKHINLYQLLKLANKKKQV